jgi:hypothetical protein
MTCLGFEEGVEGWQEGGRRREGETECVWERERERVHVCVCWVRACIPGMMFQRLSHSRLLCWLLLACGGIYVKIVFHFILLQGLC